MKYRFTLLLLVIISSSGASQPLNFSVRWGKEFNASRNSSLEEIVGFDASGIYAIKGRYRSALLGGRSYTLEHYNNELVPTKSFDLDIKENGNTSEVLQLLQLNSKLYMFYSSLNSGQKKNGLFVKEIDKSSLQPKGESFKLAEIDYSGKSNSNHGDFNFRVSRDSSKILVFHVLPYDKEESQKIGFKVLDANMNSLWQKNVTLPYQDNLFDAETYRVDNSGNVYVLGVIFKEKRKSKRNGQPNYRYEVLSFRDQGSTLVQYPIGLEDKFLTDTQIEILDDNRLVCAGFYSDKGTYSVKGTYFLSIDAATKEIKTKSFKEFSLDFIIQSMSNREANRTVRKNDNGSAPELYEYDLDKLLIGKDGSAILIGEQYFVNEVSTTTYMNGTRTTTTTYHYYYNDIIAVKISAEGKIVWAEKIAKTQHTANDGGFYSSYTLAIVQGKICFIFNDNPKNISYKGIGRPVNFNGVESVAMIASLNKLGEQERQPLLKNSRSIVVRPKVSKQVLNNQVILFAQRKKNQQFARIIFE